MIFEINEELKSFITPLSREELFTLKENILEEGCREPLIVWKKNDKESILIDGHNRYSICTEFNIPYTTRDVDFKNIDEVKEWMVDNQLGRRNLNPDQLSYYRGLKYERMKKKKGGYDKILSKGHSGPLTSEILATEFNVSEKTIKRDSQYSRGLDLIGKQNPQLKIDILLRETKIKKNDIQYLGSVNVDKVRKLKNEADLFNEIHTLKKKQSDLVDNKEQAVNEERVIAAQEYLKENDALFKTKEEQIERAKAKIVSQINQCMKEKNKIAITVLKKTVEDFSVLVLDS